MSLLKYLVAAVGHNFYLKGESSLFPALFQVSVKLVDQTQASQCLLFKLQGTVLMC